MGKELKKAAKVLVKEALKKALDGGLGGQAACRIIGSAVASTERTVYRWRAWADGAESGMPPSPKKMVALAKYCGWTGHAVADLKSKLLEG